MVQRDWWHLRSARMQVQSLAWHSGLRIWHCHSCGVGCNCGSDLIPSLGQPRKKKKKVQNTFHHRLLDLKVNLGNRPI